MCIDNLSQSENNSRLVASVLIVDDDITVNQILNRILSISGHIVVGQAYDGAEAIEILTGLNPMPDIILMDYRMPVMDGISATREILQKNPRSRIILVSADDSVRIDAFNAGALGFLTKPVRSQDLLRAIQEHMTS
jgi:two-component system chemotaxis response regulator CheY